MHLYWLCYFLLFWREERHSEWDSAASFLSRMIRFSFSNDPIESDDWESPAGPFPFFFLAPECRQYNKCAYTHHLSFYPLKTVWVCTTRTEQVLQTHQPSVSHLLCTAYKINCLHYAIPRGLYPFYYSRFFIFASSFF